MQNRWDETWHRLREWTNGQGPSERLAAQILLHEGFSDLDPSHPLGGRDGGKDALCAKNGVSWTMAVYFPRGQHSFNDIEKKFNSDLESAIKIGRKGFAFITNQELTLAERKSLTSDKKIEFIEIYHLERITAVLDKPPMGPVRKQFLNISSDDQSTNLGGTGGSAPGAGGGGGGAFGKNARGGNGGPGGNIRYEGWPATAPGAGGGGAGAEGDDAIAGDGGGGGELVRGLIDLTQEGARGVHAIQVRVGKGGENGGPGEDSVLNLVDKDGKVLKTISAKGGEAGRQGQPDWSKLPTATQEEIDSGFKTSALLLGDVVSVRNDGLLYAIAAGWANFAYPTTTFAAQWPLAAAFELTGLAPERSVGCKIRVADPDDFQVLEIPFAVQRPAGLVARLSLAFLLQFTGSKAGIWSIKILSGEHQLGSLPIEVKLPLG